jgi:hypothetical protein
MIETREEKDKSPAKVAGATDAKSEQSLLVRKRITYLPKEKEELKALELGYWLTKPIKTPYEALEVLKAFGMPGIGQIAVDGRMEVTEVTIKKRHIKARDKVKKDRHEELTTKIDGVRNFIKFLKHHGLANDQIEIVESEEEALEVIETFKRRIAPKEKK